MIHKFHQWLVAWFVLVSITSVTASSRVVGDEGTYPDPSRFEKAIQAFEQQDDQSPPPAGAVLCIGSSSMRMWHDRIREDLKPLTVIPRGFGGSTMYDVLHFADRVVLPYRPRAILLYEGDNDIANDVSPEKVLETFKTLVAKIHGKLPQTRIYVLSIKPSVRRWSMWPAMQKANQLLADFCKKDDRLIFIDVASAMLQDDGNVRTDIFLEDKLHMNRKGYEIWRNVVRPILVDKERPFEK